MTLTATKTAIGPGLTASFQGVDGVEPYVYEVLIDGAGGSIDPDTGLYTAPDTIPTDPKRAYDIIRVTDGNGDTYQAKILIGNPLVLFCEIIQKELGLADGRVYIYNQKLSVPTDNGLFIAVGIESAKPFGQSNRFIGGIEEQSVNMLASIGIDIMSRGIEARDRKEEVIMALNSSYSQQQQETNSFYIGKLSTSFVNLSEVEGAAIPNRFRISVNIQYFVVKRKAGDIFNQFSNVALITEP